MYLPSFLAGLLAEHLETHPHPYVFTGTRGGWLRRGGFRKSVWLPAREPSESDSAAESGPARSASSSRKRACESRPSAALTVRRLRKCSSQAIRARFRASGRG